MNNEKKKHRIGRPSPATVIALVALVIAISGGTLGAYAAFRVPPNSVGSRQLKAKAVTGGKIANATISGGKLEEETITGANIKKSALGTVPTAATAASAANANTVGGHAASCPANTTLIRGLCFDSEANGPVETPQEAAEACAKRGGWLPTALELYATRNELNLGTGVGSENEYTDDYYAEGGGASYHTVVIDGIGQITSVEVEHTPEHYICVYPLLR